MSFISWAIDQGWQEGKGYYNTTYPVPGSDGKFYLDLLIKII